MVLTTVSEVLPLGSGKGEPVFKDEDVVSAPWVTVATRGSKPARPGAGVAGVGGGICSLSLHAAELGAGSMSLLLGSDIARYDRVPSGAGVAYVEAGAGVCSSPLCEAEPGTGPVWTLLVSAIYRYGHAPSLF
jgi:hypothetical protein